MPTNTCLSSADVLPYTSGICQCERPEAHEYLLSFWPWWLSTLAIDRRLRVWNILVGDIGSSLYELIASDTTPPHNGILIGYLLHTSTPSSPFYAAVEVRPFDVRRSGYQRHDSQQTVAYYATSPSIVCVQPAITPATFSAMNTLGRTFGRQFGRKQ